jgi:hypothetical protein
MVEIILKHKNRSIMIELIPIVAIISVFGSTVWLTSIITNYALKRQLIKNGIVGQEAQSLFNHTQSKLNALKWGLIVLFAGLGLILIDFLNLNANSAMPFGIEAVSVAVGFLIYYRLAKNQVEERA